jgi:hypothetical protein
MLWTSSTIAKLNAPADRRAIAVQAVVDSLRKAGVSRIVFARRFELYPLVDADPKDLAVASTLDFDGAPAGLTPLTLFERDEARKVNRSYPGYRLISADSLRSLEGAVVVTPDAGQLQATLPAVRLESVAPGVWRVSR